MAQRRQEVSSSVLVSLPGLLPAATLTGGGDGQGEIMGLSWLLRRQPLATSRPVGVLPPGAGKN